MGTRAACNGASTAVTVLATTARAMGVGPASSVTKFVVPSGLSVMRATAPLGPEDAPFVQGKIVVKGAKKTEKLGAGYVGMGADGKPYFNEATFPIDIGQPGYSTTPSPQKETQVSWLSSTEDGITYRHLNVPPGDYTIAVWHEKLGELKKTVHLAARDAAVVDFTYP